MKSKLNKYIDASKELPTEKGYYQVKAILSEDKEIKRDLLNYNNCYNLAFWPNISSKIWVNPVGVCLTPWCIFPGEVLFWKRLD